MPVHPVDEAVELDAKLATADTTDVSALWAVFHGYSPEAIGAGALKNAAAGGGGGGGQPQIVAQAITAEEVAAAWYADYLSAAIALDGISPGDLVQIVWEEDDTLDEGVSLSDVVAYLADAATVDVEDNGAYLSGVIGNVSNVGAYSYTVGTNEIVGGVLKEGASLYVVLGGDAAPTTGSVTIKCLVASA